MADKEMRAVYAETLTELAEKDQRILVLEADLMRATGTGPFKEKFPERAINVGVAEANMVSIAGGLSSEGFVPFAATFGCFATRRAFDQFFLSCAYAGLNVKLVGSDPGVSAAFNGGTHMPFEDLALVRMVPGIDVVEPSDPVSLKAFVRLLAERPNTAYLRLHRKALAPLYPETERFEIGKAKVLRSGSKVTLAALGGLMVHNALAAAELLAKDGIEAEVIDVLSLKPLDSATILASAAKTGLVISIENHQYHNGLGSAIAEVLAEAAQRPARLVRMGIKDQFGEVGTEAWLLERFKLRAEDITETVKTALRV